LESIKFTIKRQAVAKQSFRFTFTGRRYRDKSVTEYQDFVKECFKDQTGLDKCPIELPFGDDEGLSVEIKAFFKIPKTGWKKAKRELAEREELQVIKAPDCDNIAKPILDALQEVAYKNDSRVYDLHIKKYYSKDPRVEVTITAG